MPKRNKILRNTHIDDHSLVALLNKPEDFHAVASRFQHIIFSSFAQLDPQINPGKKVEITEPEIKRRFEICLKWFRVMRMDLGWGQQRSLDTLAWVLANELIGIDFTLEELGRYGWSPQTLQADSVLRRG